MVCCFRVLNVRNYVGCCHGNDNDMEILFQKLKLVFHLRLNSNPFTFRSLHQIQACLHYTGYFLHPHENHTRLLFTHKNGDFSAISVTQGVHFLFFSIFSYFLSLFLFSPIFQLNPPIFSIFQLVKPKFVTKLKLGFLVVRVLTVRFIIK